MSDRIRWADVRDEAPALAEAVRALLDAGTNKTIATLRQDGSPRISAVEVVVGDDVTLGLMPGSVKARDVQRDPRVAIHSPTLEPPEDPTRWPGDAKLAGRLVPVPRPPDMPPGAFYALDVTEVVLTRLDPTGTLLVVTSWHPGRGLERIERT